MSPEENKAMVRETMLEMWSKGNLDVADKAFASDYVYHDPSTPKPITGPQGLKDFVATYRKAFPNMHLTIADQIAQGDRVVTRWVCIGTHRGDLMGISPTGAEVTVTGLTISRIAQGTIIEDWTSSNTLDVMRQLGVMPPSAGKGV